MANSGKYEVLLEFKSGKLKVIEEHGNNLVQCVQRLLNNAVYYQDIGDIDTIEIFIE